MKQDVRRIDRSPMNPQRWCLELVCGHEVWVTSKSRPQLYVGKRGHETMRQVHCPECSKAK